MHNHCLLVIVRSGSDLRMHRAVDLDVSTDDGEVEPVAVVDVIVDVGHLLLDVELTTEEVISCVQVVASTAVVGDLGREGGRLVISIEVLVVGHARVELILRVVVGLGCRLLVEVGREVTVMQVSKVRLLDLKAVMSALVVRDRRSMVLMVAWNDVVMRVAIIGDQVALVTIAVKLNLRWVNGIFVYQVVLTIDLNSDFAVLVVESGSQLSGIFL